MDSLIAIQRKIVPQPRFIVDVGSHFGGTTIEYLETFPEAQVCAFEAAPDNYSVAVRELGRFGDRVQILPLAVCHTAGTVRLNINAHNGAHSLLPIGNQRYWEIESPNVEQVVVPSTTLDDFMAGSGHETIDILKMDIQGAELSALKGAEKLLRDGAVRLIVSEVEFQPLYEGQPLFWDVATYLYRFGFSFGGLFDCIVMPDGYTHRWADAIFVGPR